MARTPTVPRSQASDAATFSTTVGRVRSGEELVGFVDLGADRDARAFATWLSARLTIGELQRLILPPCDERCRSVPHDPDAFVVLADIALDHAAPHGDRWWESSPRSRRRRKFKPIWYAGAPAVPASAPRLEVGTRLTRVAVTDPIWVGHAYWVRYDRVGQETLFRVAGGELAGDRVIAATFGPSALLPGLAGALIAPDHPPAHDPAVAVRLLAAGWAAVERGLPYEE